VKVKCDQESSSVTFLINVYRRYDVLTYWDNLKVRIVKWNKTTKDIDIATLLPYGGHF
jgi:hypothetical protein